MPKPIWPSPMNPTARPAVDMALLPFRPGVYGPASRVSRRRAIADVIAAQPYAAGPSGVNGADRSAAVASTPDAV